MRRIVAIVEGHGDVAAAPLLFRRLAEQIRPGRILDLPRPIRVKRQQLLKPGELERAVQLAARQTASGDAIVILLDTDDDCPKTLTRHMAPGRPYRETLDQPALTQLLDLDEARGAPSFDKLWREMQALLTAP